VRNVYIRFVGQARSGAWFIGDFEVGFWTGRIIWLLLRHLGQQTHEEYHSVDA
jgi:hypothetical protein